ncbi:Os06g0161300, partial [Oryza sativa Japonica Group]
VVYCQVTKIQFHAVELANFVYKGDFVPIALKHSLKLENANIRLYSLNDRHAISDLVKCFPNLQNLNFHLSWNDAEILGSWRRIFLSLFSGLLLLLRS